MWRVVRHGLRRVLFAVAVPSAVLAQPTLVVDLDNDAFNFWQAPQQRPDREYTQGVRVAVQWPTQRRLAQRLLGGGANRCTTDQTRDCRSLSVSTSQSIFTPTLDFRRRREGERPYAGWLAAAVGVERDRTASLAAVRLEVGVTGEPSLAEAAQISLHRAFGFRTPQGWDAQVPARLGAILHGTGSRTLFRAVSAGGLGATLAPRVDVRLGNIVNDAAVGMFLITGFHAPSAWDLAQRSGARRWGVHLRASAVQQAVAYNHFLTGAAPDGGAPMQRETFVSLTSVGVGVVAPGAVVEWRVNVRSREYVRQPIPHTYSSLSIIVR